MGEERLFENRLNIDTVPLDLVLPLGTLDNHESAGSKNVVRALEIIEKLMHESGSQSAFNACQAFLRLFPRMKASKNDWGGFLFDQDPDFTRQYCTALSPDWYAGFFSSLAENELEVFLKNYLHAHETWGHPAGIAALVRTMLESCTHIPIPVKIHELEGQLRHIPENLWSYLGRVDHYSTLGADFVLGKSYVSRPEYYKIVIGPITVKTLEKFQRSGWARETLASDKLHRLVEFAEPFYLKSSIHIILETVGFILGRSDLGKNKLGSVATETQESMDILMGN